MSAGQLAFDGTVGRYYGTAVRYGTSPGLQKVKFPKNEGKKETIEKIVQAE